MNKSKLVLGACVLLGLSACSDREPPAPAPVGDMTRNEAIVPPPADVPPPPAVGTTTPSDVANSDRIAADRDAESRSVERTTRTRSYRHHSVRKTARAKDMNRDRGVYRNDDYANDGYASRRTTERDRSGMGSTSPSSDAGSMTTGHERLVGRHNPAAINSGY